MTSNLKRTRSSEGIDFEHVSVVVADPVSESDRYIEAILGARLMLHHPLGSVKTMEQAKRVDQMTLRWSQLSRRTFTRWSEMRSVAQR